MRLWRSHYLFRTKFTDRSPDGAMKVRLPAKLRDTLWCKFETGRTDISLGAGRHLSKAMLKATPDVEKLGTS